MDFNNPILESCHSKQEQFYREEGLPMDINSHLKYYKIT